MAVAPRIGIVGCGNHMFEFLYNGLKWAPAHELVAICDVDEARLERFARTYASPARYTDFHLMLAEQKLDAVIVAINQAEHYNVAKAAMRAGVNVFVEKTPCESAAQAAELVALQQQTGRLTMVGFNRRYMTSYLLAKEISERAEFGPVRMYQSQFHASPYRNEAHFKINHVIHHLDLARFIMGEIELTQVQRVAVTDRMVGFTISFRAEQGGIGTIQSGAFLHEAYPMERLELLGDQRNIVVDNVKHLTYNRPPGQRKDSFTPFSLAEGSDALVWNPSHGFYPRYSHHGYENELHQFITALTDGSQPAPNIADSLRTMRLYEQLEMFISEQ